MSYEFTADKADRYTETTTAADVDTGVAHDDDLLELDPPDDAGDGELVAVLEQLGLHVPSAALSSFKKFKQALRVSATTVLAQGGRRPGVAFSRAAKRRFPALSRNAKPVLEAWSRATGLGR